MNQQQKKYAIKRVEIIQMKKADSLSSKFHNSRNSLDVDKRIELIRSGKVKLRSKVKIKNIVEYDRDKIHLIYDFDKFLLALKYEKRALDERRSEVYKYATLVKDEIMLGDSEKALNMIRKFETMDF